MRALALIAGLVAVVANAGTIDPGIADARYREYGETFSAYTCRLLGTNTDDELQVGTCTIVAPHWALTAAHVVADMTEMYVVAGTEPHRVDRVFAHAGWGGTFAKDDIALVHVARPFALAKYPPLTDGTEQAGTVCTAVGYGVTGTLDSGWIGGDNLIRAGTQLLTSQERSVWVCQIRRTGTPLPYCIAPGDSGGPLWAKAADGRTVLVGVNSYTAKVGKDVRSRAGEESGHTRVALYLEWIDGIAGKLDAECIMPGCQP